MNIDVAEEICHGLVNARSRPNLTRAVILGKHPDAQHSGREANDDCIGRYVDKPSFGEARK